MKKLLSLLLVVTLLLVAPAISLAEGVELTMGSWRTDDTAMVEQLLAKYKELTGVSIVFQPTTSAQYNSVLRMQLDAGTGPDLFYSRSYQPGRELWNAGFNLDCTDIPGVKENFVAASLEPWTAEDGKVFAVPFAAVSQPIYYNKDIFAQQGIEIPKTWEELIATCQKLKDAGITPLANGIASNWDILECVFLGMIPNYISGPEARAAYEKGEKKFNEPEFVKILSDFAQIRDYLPDSYSTMENNDAGVFFATGQSAMLMDGSWSCGTFDEYGVNWGSMAFPAPEGMTPGMCFHPDMAIAGNKATKHPEEVKAFLAWIATPEGAQITADYLPAGFFPMINAPITFKNPRVTEILALNEGKVTDARFIWPKYSDTLYNPMLEQLNALIRGETDPQKAADAIQAAAEAN
jgi:raffinose/stachyose/melibiose transport system substrate-binding protein